jgi:hypothetical protein
MIRRLSTLASALSLLLCVATIALWVRSYFANDWVGGDPAENFSAVRWERRRLPADARQAVVPADEPRFLRAIGIGWDRPRRLLTAEMFWDCHVALPLPATIFAITAILCARPWRWRRRHCATPVCATCGYDLRPECGRTPSLPRGGGAAGAQDRRFKSLTR